MSRLLLAFALALSVTVTAQTASKAMDNLATAGGPSSPEEQACLTWALQVQRAVANGDAFFLSKCMDWDRFAHLVPRPEGGRFAPEWFWANVAKGGRTACENMGDAICKEIAKGGQYKLIAVHRDGQGWKVLFRLLAQTGGFNYHDFRLAITRDGRAIGADIFVALSGESFSETVGRIMTFTLAQVTKNPNKLNDIDQAFARYRERKVVENINLEQMFK